MWLELTLSILAVYRLSHMVVYEAGPFNLLEKLRTAVFQSSIEWLKDGFNCVLCVSFWFSFFISFVVSFRGWQDYLLFSLGVAGGTTLLYLVVGRNG